MKDWQVSCSCLILTLLGQQPGFNELQAIFYKSHRPTEGPVKYLWWIFLAKYLMFLAVN